MTNELEEQFFDTFGIEPHYYCADEYVFEAMLEHECTEGNREKCKTCKKVCKSYPQITDRILLELICILSKYQENRGSILEICEISLDEIKEEILKMLIYRVDGCKHQVRTLFEEDNNNDR